MGFLTFSETSDSSSHCQPITEARPKSSWLLTKEHQQLNISSPNTTKGDGPASLAELCTGLAKTQHAHGPGTSHCKTFAHAQLQTGMLGIFCLGTFSTSSRCPSGSCFSDRPLYCFEHLSMCLPACVPLPNLVVWGGRFTSIN